MKARNKAFIRFRDAALPEAAELVKCGFELETQQTEGVGYASGGIVDPDADPEAVDETRYLNDCDRRHQDYVRSLDTIVSVWPDAARPSWTRKCQPAELVAALNHMRLPNLNELVTNGVMTSETGEQIRAALKERVSREVKKSSYKMGSKKLSFATYFYERRGMAKEIQIGSDGSVGGFEFRTIGGVKYGAFNDAAESLFKLNHVIDRKCSFHIHLSVNDIAHRYGQRLQQAMTEYVVSNAARLPATVKDRLMFATESNYFKPQLQKNKYTFVNYHDQGTWEFRCFGNVQSAAEAKICLDIAIEAMQFAYRVVSGGAVLESEQYMLSQEAWTSVCYNSLRFARPVLDTIEHLITTGEIEEAA